MGALTRGLAPASYTTTGGTTPPLNRVGEDVEKATLNHCLAHPRHGALRVAGERR